MDNANKKNYLIFLVWITIIILVIIYFISQNFKSNNQLQNIPQNWPANSKIINTEKATGILFLHPHCPCSFASLSELERLLPYIKDSIDVHIVFTNNVVEISDWYKGRLYRNASKIKDVKILIDNNLFEAENFNIKSSGHFVLYSKNQLQFHGGLTSSRGHEGPALLQSHLINWNSLQKQQASTKVFGCDLFNNIAKGN